MKERKEDEKEERRHLKGLLTFLALVCFLATVQVLNYGRPALNKIESDSTHCIFVMSSLYGNMSVTRVKKTMEWYLQGTLESIWVANDHIKQNHTLLASSSTTHVHVEAVLMADDSYLTMSLPKETKLTRIPKPLATNPIGQDDDKHLIPLFHSVVQEQACNVISLMRLDADDFLLPTCFQNIIETFSSKRKTNKVVMVSGPRNIRVLRMGLHPLNTTTTTTTGKGSNNADVTSSSRGSIGGNTMQLYCHLTEPIPRATFMSQGLAVTMPVDFWKSTFHGNNWVLNAFHDDVYRRIVQKISLMNDVQVIENIATEQALWVLTPLSAHYDYFNETGCLWDDALSLYGQEITEFIRHTASFLPSLTREQWTENFFVQRAGNKSLQFD